jgi:hypothetical protein
VVALVRLLERVGTLTPEPITSLEYVGGRLAMVASGIATVALVGLLGWRMAPRHRTLVGLVAAGPLAVSFLHVKDSHFLKPDVPTAFFTALTLWFTLDALEHDRLRSWLLAAAAVGLAARTKYTSVAVALVPAAAFLTLPGGPRVSLARGRTVALMTGVAIALILLFNPGIFLTPHAFYNDAIICNQDHYSAGHEGAEGSDTWLWYLKTICQIGFGPTLTRLLVVGLVAEILLLSRKDRRALLLLLFPVVYYLDSSRYVVRVDRQLIQILPYLALIGAHWLGFVPLPRVALAQLALVVVALAAFTVPVIKAAQWDIETGKIDTCYPALDWITANVPRDAVVAREWYTPPLNEYGCSDRYFRSIYQESADWYRSQSVQYLIIASFMYQRYLDEPDRYPQQAAFYRSLLARPALARFDLVGKYTGPVIVVFRLQDVEPVLRR